MKKLTIYRPLLTLLLLACAFSSGSAQSITHNDFSGNWKINFDKSDFGDIPHYVIARRIEVQQRPASISLKLTTLDPTNVDTTIIETLPLNGAHFIRLDQDRRERRITAQFSQDGTELTIVTRASAPNDPKIEQYEISETWTISGDILHIKKTVTTDGSQQYSVDCAFEKNE